MSRPRLDEAARFLVVGAAAYAVDVLVFNALLLQGGLPSVPAKVLSSAAAIAVAFAGSRWWTWRHRRSTRVGREYVLFVAFSVAAAGIQVGCLVLAREVLGLRSPLADNLSANVVGMALATAFRFWAFRSFVFPPGGSGPDAGGLTPAGAGTPERARGAGPT